MPPQFTQDICHSTWWGWPWCGPHLRCATIGALLTVTPSSMSGQANAVTISGAPRGSALICLISYSYIRMLGANGLKRSTEIAILNANYIKQKLDKHYEILYKGESGRAAHEFIIDCRPFKDKGIEVVDIAKKD